MKKFVLILTMVILSISLSLSIFYIFEYRKQIKLQKIKIEQLQQTISEIKAQKDKLSSDNDFIQYQYETLKSSKQKDELIDLEVQECMKKCNYTTVCMNKCIYSSEIKWQQKIEDNIRQFENNMTDNQKQLLSNSQNMWNEYKVAQQKLNAEIIGTKAGTIYTNILSSEQVSIVELRAKELKNLYSIFSE